MAQADFFLKLDGIDGESQDDKHKNEIALISWGFGATNAGSFATHTGGGGTAKVNIQDMHFTKYLDKSSPKLFQACASGKHIPTAILSVRKAGEKPMEYLKFQLSEVLVSSYQTGGSDGHHLPQESISLNFAKIEFDYKEQKPDGSLAGLTHGGWHIRENKVA